MSNVAIWEYVDKLKAERDEVVKALTFLESVFGPGVDAFGDGAGVGEIDAIATARLIIAKHKEDL